MTMGCALGSYLPPGVNDALQRSLLSNVEVGLGSVIVLQRAYELEQKAVQNEPSVCHRLITSLLWAKNLV